MITFIRTAAMAGKGDEAMAFAHEVAKVITDTTGVKMSVSRPGGGNPFRIAWMSTFETMAQMETTWNKLQADAAYRKLVESSAPLFIPGSVHDETWKTV